MNNKKHAYKPSKHNMQGALFMFTDGHAHQRGTLGDFCLEIGHSCVARTWTYKAGMLYLQRSFPSDA